MFERLDGTVSLIEYSHSSIPHNTLYSLDFALQYVSKRIIIDNSRVVHLTPFLYDTQRSFNACKSALRNWRRHSSGSADINEEESGSVLYGRLNNTQVWQCVTLTDLQRILGELSVDVYSTTETRLCDVVLIEDLDEMFNIMTFKNPSQSTYPMISSKSTKHILTNSILFLTARELILDTILLLRKISQLQGITCLVRITYSITNSINFSGSVTNIITDISL